MSTISTHTHPTENGSTRILEAQPTGMKKTSKRPPEDAYQLLIKNIEDLYQAAFWELCSILDEANPTAESLFHNLSMLQMLLRILSHRPLDTEYQKVAQKTMADMRRQLGMLQGAGSQNPYFKSGEEK